MKKLFLFLAITALFAMLSACAASASWHKQGVSDFDTGNALSQCKYEAGINNISNDNFITDCMKRQGYRWN